MSPHSFPVRLVQCQLDADHFAGVDRALAERGIASERVFPDQPPSPLGAGTKAVVLSDPFAGMNALASREALRVGATVVMVMDGVVEYRNTFVNSRVRGVFAAGDPSAAPFLRPAPADVVACSGEIDRRVLAALGNRAVATGLPRVGRMHGIGTAANRRAIMVATANEPWFNERERSLVVASLAMLKATLERMSVPVIWRLRGGLDEELGVVSDRRPLRDAMSDAAAVLTTPSTLLVEAMAAGRPTGVIHPHGTPLWQPAAWGWRGAAEPFKELDESAMTDLGAVVREELRAIHDRASEKTKWFADAAELVSSLLAPDPSMLAVQRECLALLDASDNDVSAASKLTDILESICNGTRTDPTRRAAFASPVRLPRVRSRSSRPCVVSCVVCDDVPLGGVLTWSERMSAAFSDRDMGYDFRTLLVCVKPDAWRSAGVRIDTNEHLDLCVIDPFADHIESLANVRRAIEHVAGGIPAIVMPNYTDIAYAAAVQLRCVGSRVVAVAHTDDAYYRELIGTYGCWDAGIGVSRECMGWMEQIEARTRGAGTGRPLAEIHYGVPIATTPRAVDAAGPIKLAYVGRMVQPQKRIADLLAVIDGLEERSVAYELHMVGDGVDLPAWRSDLARRTLRTGRVEFHGRRDAAWVQRFMSGIDVSVLVSEFEGTSIAMLEAMGAGVVPAVTAVRSGVDEWVVDGTTGVTAPVGCPDAMAERLARLAHDRSSLARMGRAAWEKARQSASIEQMADKYRELFDLARRRPVMKAPTDMGVRLLERWRWSKEWSEDSVATHGQIRDALTEAGCRVIVNDHPAPGCDAVIVRTDVRPLTRVQAEQIALWRECGIAVAISPHLRSAGPEDAMSSVDSRVSERVGRLLAQAMRDGCSRIAVYGTGRHTRRLASIFDGTRPFVGFIDDAPPAWEYMFGLPIVRFEEAVERLRPDAVLLSSDAWEARMWERSHAWRRAGIRVLPIYAEYEPITAPEPGQCGRATAAAA